MTNVNPIPDNYHRVTPYLYIRGAAQAIAFYKSVLGATEKGPPMTQPDGTIGHAEIMIDDSTIMLSDEAPEMGARSPQAIGGTPIGLVVYVEDCDAVTRKAVEAGATMTQEPADQFYGDRTASITDPFGFVWHIHTHIEDVSAEQMQERVEAMATAG